jgi:hypothetical protein
MPTPRQPRLLLQRHAWMGNLAVKDTVSHTPNPKSLVACGATLERPAKELLTPIARKVKISHERYYRRELGAQGLRP